ncbi:hexosaminidase [Rhizomicrobium electricum]|uniref:family 20 glycosylhydrolase n=1 Tax=Rhizomicrobium electricum TaxID=480070 RepID=UPI001420A292|nr:family 20 glycosylhydrolase [Rhizomicrobium electricum]NIJ49638.1 hexosaminidase [Rhizomicrobium electricum]
MLFRLRLTAVVLAVLPFVGAPAADLSLIPWPRALTREPGTFRLAAATPIVCTGTNDAGCAAAADRLRAWIAKSRGLTLSQAASGPAIVFRRTVAPAGEGYRLTVTPSNITIEAARDAGFLYGAATLFQLATQQAGATGEIDIPAVTIDDAPRFAWRGLMLDSVRHFQPPAAVKTLLDAMAWHKLNVLHWHLADDQGWRIEIKRYPRLTQVGAYRFNSREGRYGGYYTQAEIRDIVAYAKARNITVVPEIEMPGHALAAIAAYPRLGSVKRVSKGPSGDWGVFPYLYNVNDTTFAFLENVLSEVMALFPSPYIHIGGDEAPKDQWDASPEVQKRMRALGISDTKALQGYFTDRIGKFLLAHGRRPIGWDEIIEGHPSPDAAVMSWRTVESASEAANLGHDVVLSPAPTYYLDYCQAQRLGEPTCRGPEIPLREVYAFDPAPKGALEKHLIGVQANAWTEHMPTPQAMFRAVFPRAAALAETGWSTEHDWNRFVGALPAQFDRYAAFDLPYAPVVFAVDVGAEPSPAGARITLTNQAKFGALRYTLDGSEPGPNSPLYTAPFETAMPVTLEAATFSDGQRIGPVTSKRLDASSILRRSSWTMNQCTNDLPLAQRSRDGKVSMVNVMHPCWIYRHADLGALKGLDVSVAPLPFNFQLMHDITKIPLDPKAARSGQLEIRRDDCAGPVLAIVKLPKTRGYRTIRTTWASQAGVHDICLNFARRKVDPVWAIDWVQPLRKE